NFGNHSVVRHACAGGEGIVREYGERVPSRSVEVRGFREEAQVGAGGSQPGRSGGLSGWVVPGKAGKSNGGAAVGDTAEFLPLCADTGSDCDGSVSESGIAEDSAFVAGISAIGGSGTLADTAGLEDGAGIAGPGDARGVVFDRLARVGAGGSARR